MLKFLKRKKKQKKKIRNFELISGVALSLEEKLPVTDVANMYWDPASRFTPRNITICNELTKRCEDLSYLPETRTFVLSDKSFCKLAEKSNEFLEDVSIALDVNKNQAINAVADFFPDRSMLVQQKGIEGAIYRFGSWTQAGGSGVLVYRTISMAKLAGAHGVTLIQAQPFLIVALPNVDGMFFHSCGALIGNNTIGRTCNTIGNVLNLPMTFSESIYNVYVAPIFAKLTGISTVLNYTKQMQRGPGLDGEEAVKFLIDKDKGFIRASKDWLIERLR
jgi:hypothetical protein